MNLRSFKPEDAEALAAICRDAVRVIGPQAYTAPQVDAWARYPEDMAEFRARMSRGLTLIAEEKGEPVAFGQLDPDDHLAFLYCRGSRCRAGIGSAIYDVLEAHAESKGVVAIHTEASRISRAFFEKKGYVLVEIERVIRSNVEFERFRMTKNKKTNQSPGTTSLREVAQL
jgi:putative acetyltransferase